MPDKATAGNRKRVAGEPQGFWSDPLVSEGGHDSSDMSESDDDNSILEHVSKACASHRNLFKRPRPLSTMEVPRPPSTMEAPRHTNLMRGMIYGDLGGTPVEIAKSQLFTSQLRRDTA